MIILQILPHESPNVIIIGRTYAFFRKAMPFFAKILVGTDGSEHSTRAIKFASELARKFGSKITLAHVLVPPSYYYGSGEAFYALNENFPDEEGRKMLRNSLKKAEVRGIEVKTVLLKGNAAEELSNLANDKVFDLVVVGSRGLSTFKRLLIGSVSDKVIRFSRCPVLVVK